MVKFKLTGDTQEIKAGMLELCSDYDFMLGDGILLNVRKTDVQGLNVFFKNGIAVIEYNRKPCFFRALGLLLEKINDGETDFSLSETAYFDMNGPMFDVSQGNAAINLPSLKALIRQLAIMGMSMLMLYCEDSFDIDSRPLFGYMRARYSKEEIREADAYASVFGIEMIPCIQTLAHLTEFLRWAPNKKIAEDDECLLVGEEETYRFLEEMIKEAAEPFSTKKIHIGADEAWKLGRGEYMTRHGYTPPIEIMKIHLERVLKIVRRLGLEPMMWSDMFFRAVNDGNYYTKNPLPQDVVDSVPEDLRTIYWDYYNHSPEIYEKMIEQHQRFKSKPVFAGGVWTWNGFGPHWDITFEMTLRALRICKKHNVRDIIATVWGDNGTECPASAAMLGICMFAEAGYCKELNLKRMKKRFEFCCGAVYNDFYALEDLNHIPGCNEKMIYASNPSKFLLWQDVLCGLFDKNIEGLPVSEHYYALSKKLSHAEGRNGIYNGLFKMSHALCEALAAKSELGVQLYAAYQRGDRAGLEKLCENDIPRAQKKIIALRAAHFEYWLTLYKPLGWDVFDIRYGAVLARLDSAKAETEMYLDGRLSQIEELEVPRLPFNNFTDTIPHCNSFSKIISPSRI